MQLTQTDLQGAIDTCSILPAQSCIQATGYKTSDFVARALSYWRVDGIQEALPFAVSGPVVYYNKQSFTTAGLNPTTPPLTLTVYLKDASRSRRMARPAHWCSTRGTSRRGSRPRTSSSSTTPTAGRGAPPWRRSTRRRAAEIWTELDQLVRSGDAVTNPSTGPTSINNLLGMGTGKYGMTIDTSADLGTITQLLSAHPNVTLGVGPFPKLTAKRPGGIEPGGSALYLCNRVSPAEQAAAWTFETYLDSTQSQATWAAGTGYIPLRRSSTTTPTIQSLWRTYPGFQVAYNQLVNGPTTTATSGAVMGRTPTCRTRSPRPSGRCTQRASRPPRRWPPRPARSTASWPHTTSVWAGDPPRPPEAVR